PELTSAGVITLDGKIETVKLPKLTTLKGFAGHSIDLDEGTELTLSALASYNAEGLENLIIDLGGAEATLDLSALKNVYSLKPDGKKDKDKTLTIIGPQEVSLPELTTLALLHVKDVRSVSAPKVKAANLQINEDVVSVDVGTAEGAHINTLTFTNANDLETLQIGGNPATTNKGTVVTLNAQNTPDLERAHIHGGRSVVVDNLNDFEEIITARTIAENVIIRNTSIEGALVLGHVSGDNGGLTVEYNDDIESLTADKLNKLSRLYIKGNHDLEKISFAALKAAGNQKTGTPWYNSDAVVIGGTQFDAADRGRGENYLEADRNNLIADAIHLEVKTGPTKQDPKIVDSSGLSTLKDFLASATFGVVSYDGAKSFRRIGGDSEALEDQENAKGDDFVLWREGLKGTPSDAGKAKRVFLTPSGLRTESSASITIGVAGEFYETITFQQGGSARNWVQQIKDAEVVKFFKDNDVTLDAVVGGAPSGNFQVDTREQAEITPSAENNFDTDGNIGDMNTDNDVQGSFKLTIGDYSHEVILEPATDPVKEDVPFYDPGDGTPQKPEKKNKKAITYLDSNAHWGPGDTPSTSTIEQLVYILISAFPDGTVTTNLETTYPRAVDAWKSVPYGINDLGDANGGTNLRTAIIYTLDPQYIAIPIKVDFKGHLKISKTGRDTRFLRHEGGNSARRVVTTDIKNNETRIQVTLTSDVAGKGDKSTIGHPPTTGNSSPDWLVSAIDPSQNSNAGEGYVSSSGGYSVTEYHVNPDKSTVLRRASSLPKVGTDSVTRTGGDANLNRLGWL
ncbi:MAG: hypothetical protein OXC61_06090, partial [Flavobacteriaceae bacterium]|nr:hypothetical protein [Flavobacteriaceae bacterium]